MPIPVEITKVETIMVPTAEEFTMTGGDSGAGGEPPYRTYVMVDGKHLCYVDELPPGSNDDYQTLRAAAYEYYLKSLGLEDEQVSAAAKKSAKPASSSSSSKK